MFASLALIQSPQTDPDLHTGQILWHILCVPKNISMRQILSEKGNLLMFSLADWPKIGVGWLFPHHTHTATGTVIANKPVTGTVFYETCSTNGTVGFPP
jgi:hypothetical protein